MKTNIRSLLTDLKAATMIGSSEAVGVALDGFYHLPAVISNKRMEPAFIDQVVLPAGEFLAQRPTNDIRALLDDPLAAIRAMGGVALARRFINTEDVSQNDLHQIGGDARVDVRTALGRALFEQAEANPERLLALGTEWLSAPSPRLRFTALSFLPGLAATHGEHVLNLLALLGEEEHQEVCWQLVEAVTGLARVGMAEPVLALLDSWAAGPAPNDWVISRVLAGSWAAAFPAEALSILQETQSRTGKTKAINNALHALKRHGADIDIDHGTEDFI